MIGLVCCCITPLSRAQAVVDTRIDAVLVIDNSGSMRDNDPRNLRRSAARLFAHLLAPGDQLGVVSMGDRDSTRALLSLSQVDRLTQWSWDQQGRFDPPDDLSNWTYFGAALDLASDVLENAARRNPQRAVILLTDGLPTYHEADRAEQEQRVRDAVARLQAQNVKVFAIALGPGADAALLQRELADPTGGRVWQVAAATQLIDVYTEILALLQDGRYIDRYTIVSNVETFLANVHPRQQIRQINFIFPAGDQPPPQIETLLLPDTPTSGLDRLSRFHDPAWTLFTARPEYVPRINGQWRIGVSAATAETPVIALVQSDLRARLLEPIAAWPADDLAVRYYPAGRPLLIQAGARNRSDGFERRIGIQAQLRAPQRQPAQALADHGRGVDLTAGDGVYSGTLPPLAPGRYRLAVLLAQSDTPVRLDKPYEIVVEPLPVLQVTPQPPTRLQPGQALTLEAQLVFDGRPVAVEEAEITAAVRRNGVTVEQLPFSAVAADRWRASFLPPSSGDWEFSVVAHVTWTTPDGALRRYTDLLELRHHIAVQPMVELELDASADNDVWDGVQRTLVFRSHSDQPVRLHLGVEGLDGGQVFPDVLELAPREQGRRTITIALPPAIAGGRHTLELTVAAAGEVLLNTERLPTTITTPGWLARRRGLLVLLALLIGVLAHRRARRSLQDLIARNVELLRYGGHS